jgi:AraC-like DNA-binding protein
MPVIYSSEALLCLVSSVICVLSGVILLLNRRKNKASAFLAASYLAFGYAFLIAGLTFSRLLYALPHFYRTANIAWLLCMPLTWLFFRTTIKGTRWTGWDLLHLVPVCLYLIDFFPFFISSAEHKAAIFQADVMNPREVLKYSQGWLLPANSQVPIWIFQGILYCFLEYRLISSGASAVLKNDKPRYRWMVIFVTIQIPMYIPMLLVLVSGSGPFLWSSTILPVAAVLFSAFTLFLHPNILYGLPAVPIKPVERRKAAYPTAPDEGLSKQLAKIMKDTRPFLQPDYSLGDLAGAVGVPPYKLSAHINQASGNNFNDYLNRWRINYCIELAEANKLENLNLLGIAKKCGFRNRNTFSTAFKRVTGKTPSEYFRAARLENL